MPRRPRVAIAHDHHPARGWSVVVLHARAFPEATVHTPIYNPDTTSSEFRDATVVTSPINRVGAAWPRPPGGTVGDAVGRVPDAHRRRRRHRLEQRGGPRHEHVRAKARLPLRLPARWLYQRDRYLGGPRPARHRGWRCSPRRAGRPGGTGGAGGTADTYVVNSRDVQRRVAETYGIGAHVLHPPVGVDLSGERCRPVLQVADRTATALSPARVTAPSLQERGPGGGGVLRLPDRLVIVGSGLLEEGLRTSLPDNVVLLTRCGTRRCAGSTTTPRPSSLPATRTSLTSIEAAAFAPTLAAKAGGYPDTVEEKANGPLLHRADRWRPSAPPWWPAGDHPIDPAGHTAARRETSRSTGSMNGCATRWTGSRVARRHCRRPRSRTSEGMYLGERRPRRAGPPLPSAASGRRSSAAPR